MQIHTGCKIWTWKLRMCVLLLPLTVWNNNVLFDEMKIKEYMEIKKKHRKLRRRAPLLLPHKSRRYKMGLQLMCHFYSSNLLHLKDANKINFLGWAMAMEEKRKTRVRKCQYDRGPETVRTMKRLIRGLP